MPQRESGEILIRGVIEREAAGFNTYEFFPATPREQWEPHLALPQPGAMDP